MRAASALSTHPLAAVALGEAAGQVMEALDGARPSLVLVAVTPPHLGTLDDVGAALTTLLAPDVVVGAVAPAVVGAGRHVAGNPAVALFALVGVSASPLDPGRGGGGPAATPPGWATAALLLADPFSWAPSALPAALGGLPVAGGLVGTARGPGGSRLLLDGSVRTSGAVGALLGSPSRASASQGAVPAGAPWVVTRAEGPVVLELGGRPAAERGAEALGHDGVAAALGLVVDEQAEEVHRAELLAVPVVGAEPGGGLRLTRPIPVGRVVRFLRAGPVEAEADLAAVLAACGPGPAGLLVFPGADRRADATLASELLGCPVAGVGVSAPLAPVGRAPGLLGAGATALVLFP